MQVLLENQTTSPGVGVWKKGLFFCLGILGLFIIAQAIVVSLPAVRIGLQNWQAYLNFNWAHQENLIQELVDFFVMLWLSASALFFGFWLLNRSMRKLRGKNWSLDVGDTKRRKFFPPVLPYLKISCVFLTIVFLFVVLQYPLQFIF